MASPDATPAASRAERRRHGWFAPVVGLLVLFLFAGNIEATLFAAQDVDSDGVNRENRIKAAYLFQFGRYVEWPAEAFAGPQSPFRIGVLGDDPVAADLLLIAQTKKVQDRPIEVQKCSLTSDLTTFHILFVPANLEPEKQQEIVRKTVGKHILLVGGGAKLVNMGGSVSFVVEENSVRFYIARKAIERQGLTISAKLLQVGRVVD
jgi:hypothetical protein